MKLKGFPSVYYISLLDETARQEAMNKVSKEYGITVHPYFTAPFNELNISITGKHTSKLQDRAKGCSVSHILNLHKWYNETDEDYAIFCENDVSFATVPLWNFSWEQFFSLIPINWSIVQLARIDPFVSMNYEELDGLKIRKRNWKDWGTQIYLANRTAVREILYKTFISKNRLLFEPPDNLYALTENLIYCQFADYLNTVYSVPLFLEDIDLKLHSKPNDQTESHKYYLNLWQNNTLSIESLMVREMVNWNGPIVGRNSREWEELVKEGWLSG